MGKGDRESAERGKYCTEYSWGEREEACQVGLVTAGVPGSVLAIFSVDFLFNGPCGFTGKQIQFLLRGSTQLEMREVRHRACAAEILRAKADERAGEMQHRTVVVGELGKIERGADRLPRGPVT